MVCEKDFLHHTYRVGLPNLVERAYDGTSCLLTKSKTSIRNSMFPSIRYCLIMEVITSNKGGHKLCLNGFMYTHLIYLYISLMSVKYVVIKFKIYYSETHVSLKLKQNNVNENCRLVDSVLMFYLSLIFLLKKIPDLSNFHF